jgi:hypothetical protein
MVSDAVALLSSAQDASGGWGWLAGQPANTECSALAVMALHAHRGSAAVDQHAVRRGLGWLQSRQRPDGSWPLSDQVPGSSWMSSLAVLALAHTNAADERAVRGAMWLLGQRSREQPWLHRVWQRFFPEPRIIDQDHDLVGWPWTADTSAWVEPTAWSLLALKQLAAYLPSRLVAERIRDGELLLADRMCAGGGWNYGNRRVLGEDLSPYPDTTALALIALHDSRDDTLTGTGLRRLQDLLHEQRSTLALALSCLCLRLYTHDPAQLRTELSQRLRSDRVPDTRSLALALLALDQQVVHFEVRRNA